VVLDTSTPSLARAYDYLLGGGASFAADRALAGRMAALYPKAKDLLQASRTYAAASITSMARQGVGQYLDVGSGLPTRPSTHEIARALVPGAHIVYADRDPVVVEHGAALVPSGVRYVAADLTEPESLLSSPEITALIDFSRPVGVVLGLVVQALDPGTARAVVGVLVRALAPGSYLVVTAGAGEAGRLPDSVWPGGLSAADLASFLGGLDLVPPGITEGDVLCGTGYRAPRA
jgi:S-adenosyl methyltransferase